MSDFTTVEPSPPIISSWMKYGPAPTVITQSSSVWPGGASMTWGLANRAIYVPLRLPFPYQVKRVWYMNGSVITGNVDVGIYSANGSRLYNTGSVAQSGGVASTPRYTTLGTPLLLPPGYYYMAVLQTATTANLMWGATTFTLAGVKMAGVLQQDVGAATLPATATFATLSASIYPLIGISRNEVVY